MNVLKEHILYLIKRGLWGCNTDELGIKRWDLIFEMAKEQAMLGLVLDGVYSLPSSARPDTAFLIQWSAIVANIERANKHLDSQVAKWSQLLKKKDIPYAILKGQGVAQNYPNPSRRQCGDIDVFVGEENYEQVNKLFELLGAQTKDGEEMIRHCSWFIDGIEVEVHRYPAIMATPSYNRHLRKMTVDFFPNKLHSVYTKDSVQIRVPSLEFDTCYILVHAMHHVYDRGLGLRQPLDWLMLLYKNRDNISVSTLESNLSKLGLLKAARAVTYIGVKHLGFQQRDLPIEAGEEKIAHMLLNDIFESGNFGHHSNVNQNRPKGKWSGKWYAFSQRTKRLLFLRNINAREAAWFNIYVVRNFLFKMIKGR